MQTPVKTNCAWAHCDQDWKGHDTFLFITITWKSGKKLTYITEGIESTFYLATDVQLDYENTYSGIPNSQLLGSLAILISFSEISWFDTVI